LLVAGKGWVRPFFNGQGIVVMTSRLGGDPVLWGNWIVPHPVKMLDPTAGAQVLLDHTRGRGGSQAEAQALSERLGGLSLALTLAGAYLAQAINDPWPESNTITTFNGFRSAINDGRTDILKQPIIRNPGQPGERESRVLVDGIWQLTVEFLNSRNLPLAGTFMRLLSQFANAPLPYQLMLRRDTLTESSIFAGLGSGQVRLLLRDMDHLDLISLMPTGTASGLILADSDLPVLRMHPLMRDASQRYRDLMHDDDAYIKLASRLLVEAVAGEEEDSPEDHRRWPLWQLLAPHAFHLLRTLSSMSGIDVSLSDQVGRVVDFSCRYLFSRGLRSQAKIEYEALYEGCCSMLGDEHPRTLAARHGIALIYANYGEYAKAQAENEAVLDLRNRILGKEHSETLSTRINLAGLLHDRGEYEKAQEEYEEVINIGLRVLGEGHFQILSARNNLAGVLQRRGDYARALKELEAVFDLQQRLYGDEHPHTLTARHNLAGVIQKQGDYTQALKKFEAVLELQLRILGNEHPNTLSTRGSIAIVRQKLGQDTGTLQEIETILELQRQVLGEDHPDTLSTRNDLAYILYDRREYVRAREEYETVLHQQCRIQGEEHPDTLGTRHNIANLLRDRGLHAKAQMEYEEVLDLVRRRLGEEHPDTLTARGNLASLLRFRGNYLEAKSEYEAILAIRTQTFGIEHENTLDTRLALARVLFAMGQHSKAIKEAERVLSVQERLFGTKDSNTTKTRENLKFMRRGGAGVGKRVLWHGLGKRKKKKR
jgi:tetratricopeptide (TPR) repeat protein